MENSKYSLKRPVHYYRTSEGVAKLANETLTDGEAEAFLKGSPERIEAFAEYPEDWQALIGIGDQKPKAPEGKADKKKELEALKMGEIKEAYPEVKAEFGMKKSEYIDAVLAHLGTE